MSIDRRLARVERVFGEAGACPLCRGEGGGPWIVVQQWNEPVPDARGCPGCGKHHDGCVRIVLSEAEPATIERPGSGAR